MGDTTLLITDSDLHRWPKYYLASFSAWLGSVAIGSTLGYTSAALKTLKDTSDFTLTNNQVSWLGSLLPLGAIFGCALAGPSIEYVGRRGTLIFTSLPFIFGWLLMTYSGNFSSTLMLFTGRFVTGFSTGLVSMTAPVYIAETAPPSKRGFLGSGFQLAVTIGIFLTYFVGKYIAWSWLAGQSCLYPTAMLIAMLFMPESPTWLVKKGRISDATEALLFLHGHQGTNSEISITPSIVSDGLSTDESNGNLKWKSFFVEFTKPNIYKPIFLSLALMFFQQFSGVNAFIMYTTDIFKSNKSSSLDPIDGTIIVGGIQVIATFVACFLTDRAGRRALLMISGAGCVIGLIIYILFIYVNQLKIYGWLPVLSLVVFITAFSLGQGPIPWLMMSEILPAHVKGPASGITSSFNWLCAFIVTKNFDLLEHMMGDGGVYILFASFMTIGCVFVGVFLPETKGKSLQEIENHFKGLRSI